MPNLRVDYDDWDFGEDPGNLWRKANENGAQVALESLMED